jgi:hypothetical protein
VKTLGKYELLSELSRGAMGVVYKARDPLLRRLVAVKTITTGLEEKPELLERFYREARSAGSLQHPNIVTIYEFGEADGIPFIAMEYVEGESLDRVVVSRAVLPLFLKLGYIVSVCEALDHAHRHGVIHRDIKPGNIMVTKEGAVKVVDFAIARLINSSRTRANLMLGSRPYMSPQMYQGERADARSDVWAVGVTLYELLTYQRPFAGEKEAELKHNILHENPPSLRSLSIDCSEEIERIITRMLEKKTEARFQCMRDLLHDLRPPWRAAQQVAINGLLADSRQLIEAHDLERAQSLLRKALHVDARNLEVKSLLERVTAQLRRDPVQPRIDEHLTRGRDFLRAGHLREARAEAQATLELDSKHETAQRLLSEVEEAVAHAQQLEQKLRLAKQRLAEGALTEAAAAIAQALELDAGNRQARDLEQRITEEQNRQEKRKKLAELLHRARSLWAELNYNECLAVLADALQEFPKEPELLKLQETARNDQAEEQKRVRLAEVRKLLGEQRFSDALKVIDELGRNYPQDPPVESLRGMAQQGLQEQKVSEYLQQQVVELRSLVNGGQYAEMISRAERLLNEYPQEFALRELLTYARGELAFQKQRQRLKECEQPIRDLLEAGRSREAEEAALRGGAEFPQQIVFQQLQQEAADKRKDREAREEIQGRIQAIEGKTRKDKLTDAVDTAQQTPATPRPDADVARSFRSAQVELGERARKQEEQQQFEAAKTLLEAGRYTDATELLNRAIATQTLMPTDPRTQELLTQIQQHRPSPRSVEELPPAQTAIERTASNSGKPPAKKETKGPDVTPSAATMTSPPQDSPPRKAPDSAGAGRARKTEFGMKSASVEGRPSVSHGDELSEQSKNLSATPVRPQRATHELAEMWRRVVLGGEKFIMQPIVLVGLGFLGICVLGVVWWLVNSHAATPSADETKAKNQALQLWSTREFDLSEQKWKELAQRPGALQKEAIAQVRQIEDKRAAEKKRFEEGEALLNGQKDYSSAQKAFQEVVAMNMWLSADAQKKLDTAKALTAGADIQKQEQDQFEQGEKFFQSGNYEQAEPAFKNVLTLNLPNSLLRPQAESYLKRIRQSSIDKKTFDSALVEAKNENWAQARNEFTEIVNRGGPLAQDAKKQLALIQAVQKMLETFSQSINGGSYQTAKNEVEAARSWPKTQGKMLQQLVSAQQQELNGLRSRSQGLEEKGDVGGLEHLQDDLHRFSARAEDSSVVRAANELDKSVAAATLKLREDQSGAKAAFEAAVRNFEKAKENGDINQLNHSVILAFQKIANGNGMYADAAKQYLQSSIPNAIQQLKKAFAGKAVVPSIECRGHGLQGPTLGSGAIVECAQLDAAAPLEWVGRPTVDLPDKPGKLPYTLHLIVIVDPKGDVKLEKAGTVDNDFFKKAKEAAKHWKTTAPLSGGKPVSVKFLLEINFPR